MGTHNICLYKGENKKYTGCNLKTTEILNCALIGACAVIRSNTVFQKVLWTKKTRVDYIVGTHSASCFQWVPSCYNNWYLSMLDTSGIFSIMFYKGDNFCNLLFAFLHSKLPTEKEVYSKMKELAPWGIQLFYFHADPFSEWWQRITQGCLSWKCIHSPRRKISVFFFIFFFEKKKIGLICSYGEGGPFLFAGCVLKKIILGLLFSGKNEKYFNVC